MLEEEVIIKTERNNNERLLFANVIFLLAISALFFGGNTEAIIGLLIAMGLVPFINVFSYRYSWIDAKPFTRTFFILALLPYFAALAITAIGLKTPIISISDLGNGEFWRLDADNPSLITSGALSPIAALTPNLLAISIAATGLSVYFITESRYVIRRILFFGAMIASIIAVGGFGYECICLLDTGHILPRVGISSFATFTDTMHWSTFAMIWCGAALATAIYTAQRYRMLSFSYSFRFISLLIAAILLFSILYCGTPLQKILTLTITCFAGFFLAIDTYPTENNLKRHNVSRSLRHSKSPIKYMPFMSYLCIAMVCILGAIATAMPEAAEQPSMLIVNADNPNSISIDEKRAIFFDTLELIKQRPEFGWGSASFQNVFSFFQGSDLGDSSWLTPSSDLMQKLLENGYIGLILAIITPAIFLLFWIIRLDFSFSGMVLMLTIFSTLILSLTDYPFESPCVLLSFWIVMMSAFRWDNADIR